MGFLLPETYRLPLGTTIPEIFLKGDFKIPERSDVASAFPQHLLTPSVLEASRDVAGPPLAWRFAEAVN
jgi:hypothetical protein